MSGQAYLVSHRSLDCVSSLFRNGSDGPRVIGDDEVLEPDQIEDNEVRL